RRARAPCWPRFPGSTILDQGNHQQSSRSRRIHMGLSISVGALVFALEHDPESADDLRRELAEVNRVLRANGLPEHHEPETLPPLQSRFRHVGQPYDWLHYLRRAVAHAILGKRTLKPAGRRREPSEDPAYDRVLCSSDSHVVCHSDCEGFYVPVDFPS